MLSQPFHASCSVVVSRICLHALRRDGTGWVCWLWPKLPLRWRLAWARCRLFYGRPALHASCSVVVSRICLHALRRDGTGWVCWLWPKLPLLWRLAWAPCRLFMLSQPSTRAAVSSSPESAFTHSAAMALAGFAGYGPSCRCSGDWYGPHAVYLWSPSPPRELQCRRLQNSACTHSAAMALAGFAG